MLDLPLRKCIICGNEYKPRRHDQKYCCRRCHKTGSQRKYNSLYKEELAEKARIRNKSKQQERIIKAKEERQVNPYRRKQRAVYAKVHRTNILQQPCQVCGNAKSEMHHPDYDNAYNIVWLCHSCHQLLHADERRKAKKK